jgi:hypothetical protein
VLSPGQWKRLIERIGEIENPAVSRAPSDASLKVKTPRKDD